MFLHRLCLGFLILLLGGCAGWVAETRLIPVAERDLPGLQGTYESDDGASGLFSPAEDGLLFLSDASGNDPPAKVAYDMLREEQPEELRWGARALEDNEAATPFRPDRSYLIEVPVEGDEGKVVYYYTIVRVEGSEPVGSFRQYTVLCSKAAEAFAARKEDKLCIFDDYARLRAAALDALAWYDDARMEVDVTTFNRQPEEAKTEPDGS
ncbi:MAG: hypothetical protein ACKO1N_13305 [Erythrobacter sp.]